MTIIPGRVLRLGAAILGLVALCGRWAPTEEPAPSDRGGSVPSVGTPETSIAHWPPSARSAARALIEKYGEPTAFDADKLVWDKNGVWEKTVVYRKSPQSLLGMRGENVVEQTLAYEVPDDKTPELERFDGRVHYDKAGGLLSSRAESESLNYLTLNLVDEIATGKRTADDARYYYRKTIELSGAGKSSAYMDGLLFPTRLGGPTLP